MTETTTNQETNTAPAITDAEMNLFITDMAFQAQQALGKPDGDAIITEITQRVISRARTPIDVRAFMGAGVAYDFDLIGQYVIENGDPNDIINVAFASMVPDASYLLTSYIEANSAEKPNWVNAAIPHFIRIVPNLNVQVLASWAIEERNKNVLLALALNYPLMVLNRQHVLDDIVAFIMNENKWSDIASLFTSLPGLIEFYKDAYDIQARLSDASEENRTEVEGFVNGMYATFPDDVRLHTNVMAICKNPMVEAAFAKIATNAFMDLFDQHQETCGADCGHDHGHDEDIESDMTLCENGCVSTDECLSPEDCAHGFACEVDQEEQTDPEDTEYHQ